MIGPATRRSSPASSASRDTPMTALFQARLQLDERLTPAELAGFETVFSELLDAAATAHLRDGGGDWLIAVSYTHLTLPTILLV